MRVHYLRGTTALVVAIAIGACLSWERPAETSGQALEASAPATNQLYTCSMHPQILQDSPGSCPICGMDLNLMPPSPGSASIPDPAAGIRVSPNFTQNFAVRTSEVMRGHLATGVRTVGYLDHDEGRVATVHVKFSGWIERALVNTVGEVVEEGELLFEIYSPEIVTAQQEYRSSMGYAARLRAMGAGNEAVERAEALRQAAEERLLHWGLTAQQVARLRAGGEPTRTLEVYSPASGFLVEKAASSLVGMRVTPGTAVLKIADHSTLWVKVEFHEQSVKDLRPGLRAEITLEAYPRRTWNGEVLFFEPSMNSQTQTLTGLVEVPNPDGLLRPKMYATVNIRLPGVHNAVIAPAQAVLHTGDRSVVIIAAGDGLFVPREVETGVESDGQVQVLQGLEPGEHVVTSSQFLFDSESNLRTAISQLLEMDPEGAAPHVHHAH